MKFLPNSFYSLLTATFVLLVQNPCVYAKDKIGASNGYVDVGGFDYSYDWFDKPEAAKKIFIDLSKKEGGQLLLHQALSFSEVCKHFRIDCEGFEEGKVRALFTAAIEEKRRQQDHNSEVMAAIYGALGGVLAAFLFHLLGSIFRGRFRATRLQT